LAACVFLAALFKINPVGIETGFDGIDSDKKALQQAAWQQCKPQT